MSPRPPTDWIALNLLPGLGPVAYRRLLDYCADPGEIAYRLPLATLAAASPKANAGTLRKARRGLHRRAERELAAAQRAGIRLIPRDDPGYPAELLELPDRPLLLYVRGALRSGVPRVAVVGSRAATAYGRRVATGLGAGLAERGFEVVSGGARGIDGCAHVGALEADGRTLAVLGSGMLEPYPPEHADLFDRIAERGALVSEFPLDCPPGPSTFPQRNRLVSGLSAAVVVVEAAARSGALITAGLALEQGREVMAVPGPVSSARSVGANRLIQQGARLVQSVDDLVSELSPMYRAALPMGGSGTPREEPADLSDLTPDEAELLGILDEIEPVHVDVLADSASFGVARLQAALYGLQIRGAVELQPGRYYLLRPRKDP